MDASSELNRATTPETPDSRARKTLAPLTPRFRSYLSSGNLFNLGSASQAEQKKKTDHEWPDLVPNFDETTTPDDPRSEKWMMALRHRLWYYDEMPLDIAYNAPIRWIIDGYFKISKEKCRLQKQLLELEQENRDLRSTVLQRIPSHHRISRSFTNGELSKDLPPILPRRQHSNSTPVTTSRNLFGRTLGRASPQHTKSVADDILVPAFSRNLESAMSYSFTGSSGDTPDRLSDEEEEFESRQKAAIKLTRFVASQTGTSFGIHYPEIAMILRVPTVPPAGMESLENDNQTAIASNEDTTLIEEPGMPSGSSTPAKPSENLTTTQRRIFSFYPGDDNILGSLERYAAEQKAAQSELERGLVREQSQTSVVTVVPIKKEVSDNEETISDKESNSPTPSEQPPSSQAKSQVLKPQGPVAAAIAATARFGKGAKRSVRQVI